MKLSEAFLGVVLGIVFVIRSYVGNVQQRNQLSALNILKHQLNSVRQFYNDLLGLIPQGLTLLDSSQNIIYANSRVTEILQCNEADIFPILINLSNNNAQSMN